MLKYFIITCFILATKLVVSQDLTASQVIPHTITAGASFVVEIKVNRGIISGFMKLQQELPKGFTATEIDSKGGSFTALENGIKIVWISPPSEVAYSVSYKINVPAGASGQKSLTAKYSYIKDNERSFFELEPKIITIENTATITKVLSASYGDNDVNTAKLTETIENSTEEKIKEEPLKTAEINKVEDVTTPNPTVPSLVEKNTTSAISAKTYRVQIGAFSTKPNFKNVTEITTVTLENGITKYFSGDFVSKEEAVKRHEELLKGGFPSAFIVNFENGKVVKK